MSETFHTRIPTLPDSELEEYRRNYSRFELEAVEAALAELRKRGHAISDDEIDAIRAGIHARETGGRGLGPGIGNQETRPPLKLGRRQIRRFTATVLALGLGSAITIYFTAKPTSDDPFGSNLLDSKKSLRELEFYGGKANVLSAEFQQWFIGLWHGRTLAATIAVLTIVLASAFWFIASNLASDVDAQTGEEPKPQ